MKRIAVVPTLLTLGNAVCGLAAIAYASKIDKIDTPADLNQFYLALSGWLILAAMVFDALDGYFARLFKAAGLFGAELDSLCDAVSFGAAPAFLLLQLGPGRQQPLLHSLLAAQSAWQAWSLERQDWPYGMPWPLWQHSPLFEHAPPGPTHDGPAQYEASAHTP